jgi:hypothetical protein
VLQGANTVVGGSGKCVGLRMNWKRSGARMSDAREAQCRNVYSEIDGRTPRTIFSALARLRHAGGLGLCGAVSGRHLS